MSKHKASRFNRTDAGNAELIADLFGDVLRYDHRQGRWLIWDEGRWNEDKTNKVRTFALKAARHRRRVAARLADTDRSKVEMKWAFASEHRYRLDAALEITKSLPPICDPGDGWDADPFLIGVANGVIDLRTGQLREEHPEDRITKHSPVRHDACAKCPRFTQFMHQIFGGDCDLVRFVQKAAGYSLTGNTSEQCIFILYGSGANGKTTFLEILLHIAGDKEYGADLPVSDLEVKRNGRTVGEGVNLPGARVVKSVEIREGRPLDEARVKAWSGGDTISVRPLYHNAFSFLPTHKLWLAVNHKPVITDNSAAMWRRIKLIPFQHTFEGTQADKSLLDKLKAEASGILNWLIEGCLMWQKEGLGESPPVEQATASYRNESDQLGQFIEECCVSEPGATVTSAALWKRYQEWVTESKEKPLSRQAFADGLKRSRFQSGRSGHGGTHTWIGLRLRAASLVPSEFTAPRTPSDGDMLT